MDSAYLAIIFLAVVPVAIAGQIYLLVCRMSEPEKMIRPIAGGLSAEKQAALLAYKDWLTSANLNYLISFQFGSIQVVVFQHGNAPRFFAFMFHQKLTYAAESYTEDLTVLDTGTSGNIGLFPRPGAYAQDFPHATPADAWKRHLEAEEHLTRKFGVAWRPLSQPYEQILAAAMRLRMKHVRSVPFWPFRVVYRYFITRQRLVNRSVAQQYP